jgi:hypothetical protein
MHITFDEIHRRVHLYSRGHRPHGRTVEPHGPALQDWTGGCDAWQAKSFIDRHFRDFFRLHQLRSALVMDGHDGRDLVRCTDDDLIQAAVLRLTSGAWCVVYEVEAVPAAPAPGRAGSPLVGSGPARGGPPRNTASSARPAPVPAPARAPASAPAAAPAAPVSEWSDGADQVAQAQALEQAARSGVPFCEICAARQRAAEGVAA